MKVMVYYGKHDIRFEERIELKKNAIRQKFFCFMETPVPGVQVSGRPLLFRTRSGTEFRGTSLICL